MSAENTPTIADQMPPPASRQERRAEMAASAIDPRNGMMFVPKDMGQLLDFAAIMARSGPMIKDTFRENPGACAGLISICAPLRMNPYQVSWKCYQTKQGAPLAFEAQLVVAMILRGAPIRGRLRYDYDGDGTNRRCRVSAIDRETGDTVEAWSAPIGLINPKNSPLWKTDPDQQLGYYTARLFARRHYPEVLMGILSDDEVQDMPAERAQPRDVTPAPPSLPAGQQNEGLPEDDGQATEGDVSQEPAKLDVNDFFAPSPEELAAVEEAAKAEADRQAAEANQ